MINQPLISVCRVVDNFFQYSFPGKDSLLTFVSGRPKVPAPRGSGSPTNDMQNGGAPGRALRGDDCARVGIPAGEVHPWKADI